MYDLIVEYMTVLATQVLPFAVALRILFDLFCSIVFDKRF